MSILTDRDILQAINDQLLAITPFDKARLGPNSYDVTLARELRTYKLTDDCGYRRPLDCQADNPTTQVDIPSTGLTLQPGVLYLGSTVEWTNNIGFAPKINGKSSLGRLGLNIHATAGEGDVGFAGTWTLELSVVHPLVVYAGMPVAQLLWSTITSPPIQSYRNRASSKYQDQQGPTASRMHQNFKASSARTR